MGNNARNDSGQKKKLMLISPMLHQGGFERICVLTARLLAHSYQVMIVVFSMEDIAFDISGLQVVDLNLKARPGRLGKLLNLLKRGVKLTILQKKSGTDISYSFGMTANIANALSFGAKKKISACHSFEEIKNKQYMRLIGRHTDRVLCCSKKMAELVRESYGLSNMTPLWNPCDLDQLKAQSRLGAEEDLTFFKGPEKVLVSMGREDDVKGFWHLIKVFRRIHEQEKDTQLAVIGEGEFEEYKRLVRELELEEKVFFTGLKKNPFPYLRESDIYLLTSLSEGLPNALVEALALSLPVVSVNCLSGPAEILHGDFRAAQSRRGTFKADYGILTPPLSPEKDLTVHWEETGEGRRICLEKEEEALAEAVLELLRDQELYGHYRSRAVARAEAFSAANYREGLLTCMEQLQRGRE